MTTTTLHHVANDMWDRLELNQVQRLALVLAAGVGVLLILFPPFCKPSGPDLIFTGFYPIFEWMGRTSPDGVIHFRLLSFMIVETIMVTAALVMATGNNALAAHRVFINKGKRAATKCPACGLDRHGLEKYCACGYEFEVTTDDDETPTWVSKKMHEPELPTLPGTVSLDINEPVKKAKRPRVNRRRVEEMPVVAEKSDAVAADPSGTTEEQPLLVAPELAEYLRKFEEIDLQDVLPYHLKREYDDILPDPAQLSFAVSMPSESDPNQLELEIEAERRQRPRIEQPLETPPQSTFKLADEDRKILLRVARLRADKHNRTAEELLRNTLEIRIREQGRKHPVIATYLTHWADIVQERGDIAMAEDMYQRALDILQNYLDERDPQALPSIMGYATLLRKMERDEAAVAFEELASSIRTDLPEIIRNRDLTNKLIPIQVWLSDGEAIPEEALFEDDAAMLN